MIDRNHKNIHSLKTHGMFAITNCLCSICFCYFYYTFVALLESLRSDIINAPKEGKSYITLQELYNWECLALTKLKIALERQSKSSSSLSGFEERFNLLFLIRELNRLCFYRS